MTKYYIGTSGWHYEHWKDIFYHDLKTAKWLDYYSEHFETVELNNSFYHLPAEKAFKHWHDSVPKNFVFSVKASRYITHIKRLKDSQEAMKKFLSRAYFLEEKLGVLLYQLPPQMKINTERLEEFLSYLPPTVKHVFEFRNESWLVDSTFDLLRKYHAGFCIFDLPGYTSPLVATSNFSYIRFHGSQGLYSSSYSDTELKKWAKDIRKLNTELESVFIYFNNDAEGYAIDNAKTLRKILEIS
jgi:uncharacterized protein YecE (DUF72 family)